MTQTTSIELNNVPNQEFTVTFDNVNYIFTFRFIGLFMVYDLSINNVVHVTGRRIFPYTRLILNANTVPEVAGNFILNTANDDYPIYTRFGVDQFLYYIDESTQ